MNRALCEDFQLMFFISDYESLRIGGLVFAVVLFVLGIALVVSKWLSTSSTLQVLNAKTGSHRVAVLAVFLNHTAPQRPVGRNVCWCTFWTFGSQHRLGPCVAPLGPPYLHSVICRHCRCSLCNQNPPMKCSIYNTLSARHDHSCFIKALNKDLGLMTLYNYVIYVITLSYSMYIKTQICQLLIYHFYIECYSHNTKMH